MKYVWVVMAAFFFGLGAGLLLCNSTINHLRRRLRALRREKKLTPSRPCTTVWELSYPIISFAAVLWGV